MLTYDPKERCTAEYALHHKWIARMEDRQATEEIQVLESLENLQEFRTHSMLQKAIMTYMGTHMINKQEEAELRDVFQLLDKNGDGQISQKELLEGYLLMYGGDIVRAHEEVVRTMKRIDLNKNGTIDYNGTLRVTNVS